MASVADICNTSLSIIGSDTVVTSISPPDGSVEAGHCARFYPIARKEALAASTWNWAKTRVLLAPAPSNPSTVWLYAYALPADCINPKRVLQQNLVEDFISWPFSRVITSDELILWTERGSADFEIETDQTTGARLLLANEPDAVLLYTRDVTDTTKFEPVFVTYLSYLLAAYLAGPIIKGQAGAQAAGSLRQIAQKMMGLGAVVNANQSAEGSEHIPDFIRGR